MRILINFLQARSGGALSYLRNFLPCFSDVVAHHPGAELVVLTYAAQKTVMPDMPAGPHVRHVVIGDVPRRMKALREVFIVRRVVARHQPDVLFTPYQVALAPAGVYNVTMLRNMEPFLHWRYPYSMRNRVRNMALASLTRLSLRRADRVVAVSDFAAAHVAALGVPANRISTIHHGRDERFRPEPGPDDDGVLGKLGLTSRKYIFTTGSLLPYRRLEVIIEAYGHARHMAHLPLVIAGDGSDRRYRRRIREAIESCGRAASIIRLGHVDVRTMMVLYRHAAVFVTATEIEACPNIAIEAMASGCAVIASDKPPLPEMFGAAVTYFRAGDAGSLARRLDAGAVDGFAVPPAGHDVTRFSWCRCAAETFAAIHGNPTE